MKPFFQSICTLILLLAISSLVAQDFSAFDCPVNLEDKKLAYPFTGGFHAPQFSNADLDQDGRDDLFVFDRAGSVPMVFLHNGGGTSSDYTFTRQFRKQFPDSLLSWAYMRDYNRDGLSDLMVAPTYANISGIQVYESSYDGDTWSYQSKRMGNVADKAPIIWYRNNSNWNSLYCSFVDLPEIIDVDGDGDLDVLSFESGGSYVSYYRNLQEEDNLPKDTMKFELGDRCFGKFKEGGTSGDITLSNDIDLCASRLKGGDTPTRGGGLHSGSTVMAYDQDGDGDLELLLGDIGGNNLVYLENNGSESEDLMNYVSNNFPEYDFPVNMDGFLAAHHVDIDADGLIDILVSPNVPNRGQNVDNIWYYKNTGNPDLRFDFRQRDFLTEETLDFGSYSVPIFIDENGDGLMDILVGSGGYHSQLNSEKLFLALLRNVGTESEPAFELIDEDFLGFSEYFEEASNPSIAAGDLDSDGDIDLLIADIEGDLFYYENTAGSRSEPMTFTGSPVINYMDIKGKGRARPAIVDLNDDGLNDIVIGETRVNFNITDPNDLHFGTVAYYQNQGTIGEPEFNPDPFSAPNTNTLGRMHTKTLVGNQQTTATAPHFITVDNELQVLLGSESGKIKRYAINRQELYQQFELLDSIVDGIDEGRYTTVNTYDIDNDGYLEMMIGNLRGGISFYNTEYKSDFSDSIAAEEVKGQIRIYPNPTHSEVKLDIPVDMVIQQLSIVDISGKALRTYNQRTRTINLEEFTSGIYLINIKTVDTESNHKIVKL